MAGPVAGVILDRFDRKRIMLASDFIRAVVALAFVLTVHHRQTSLLYGLSALLMGASPFFTGGRTSYPADYYQPGGIAHGQFADPDHAMDHPDDRHAVSVKSSTNRMFLREFRR